MSLRIDARTKASNVVNNSIFVALLLLKGPERPEVDPHELMLLI